MHFLHGQDRASLAQIIRHSLVMLVPSYSETFGLIALEASASGIPVLAGISAPTALAVRTADETGLTLAGFVRGDRMSIYANSERILRSRH